MPRWSSLRFYVTTEYQHGIIFIRVKNFAIRGELCDLRRQQKNFFCGAERYQRGNISSGNYFFTARFYVEIFYGSSSLTVEIYGGEAALLGLSNITRARLGHTTTQLEFTPATW